MRVYLFSPIPYSFLHQRPQKIADELVRRSIGVTFIEPYGLSEVFAGRKKIRLSDFWSSLSCHVRAVLDLLLRRIHKAPPGEEPVSPAFEILTLPFVIPSNRVNSPMLDRLNAMVYRTWLHRTVLRRDRSSAVALVEQPFFGSVLRKADFPRLFCDVLDDISIFSGHGSADRFRAMLDRLMDIADGVFVTARALMEELQRQRPGLAPVRIPNGVDYEQFARAAGSGRLPEYDRPVDGPVCGYVGILRSWFDYELIRDTAEAHGDLTFVLIGPWDDEKRIRSLRKLANVHLLGRKPYEEVASYIGRFTVGLIPFRSGAIAETTNPVKVFEYFALGKPVVSTWMRELVPFQERGLLSLVKSREEFVVEVRRCLHENDERKQEERRDIARRHGWNVLVDRMVEVMQGGGAST